MWLRGKITAAMAVLIGMPLLLCLGVMWFSASATLRDTSARDLEAATQSVATAIDARIALDLTHLRAWSALPVMQDTLIADDGGDVASTIAALKTRYNDFSKLVVADARGVVIAATAKEDRGLDLSTDDGHVAAMSGRVQQSAYGARTPSSTETIAFTVPLIAAYDRQSVIGTLTGTLDVETLMSSVVASSTLAKAGHNVVVTRRSDGRIAFAAKRDGTLFDALKAAGIVRGGGATTIDWKAEPYLVASVVPTGKTLVHETGFAVLGLAPAAAIFSAADRLLNVTMLVGVIAAVLALYLAWHWSTPLVQLETTMSRVARGDVSARAVAVAPQHTFAPLARSVEVFRQTKIVRDRLVAREADLARAKEDAESALHKKSEHLASLALAFKTQMSAIVELADAINRENLQAIAAGRMPSGHAGNISRAGVQLLAVINDLFDLSEAEAGHLSLDETEIDLSLLVRDSVDLMNDAAAKAKVSMSIEGADSALPVRADGHKLRQVMFNLLSNAIKFTPEAGQVKISLRTDAYGRPAVAIEDTGIGMPANLSPVAFSSDKTAHGPGLGLPLVRRLVELHQGSFEIDSEVGRGTIATVALPVERLVVAPVERERLSA